MRVSSVAVLKQTYAGTSAALSVFITGCWLIWPSPAVHKITVGETDLHISSDQISWIVALMDFGNILSPVPSSYLADFLGRKKTLLFTAFLYLGTWLLAIFGTSAKYLYIARIAAGIGKGIAVTVVPMYLGEIAEVNIRGALSTVFTCLFYFGILFGACVGPFVSYKVLNILCSIGPVIFFFTFVSLPDSPYFLIMKQRKAEARKALAWLRNAQEKDEKVNWELEQIAATVEKDTKEKGSFKDLWATPGNRKALAIVLFLSAFQRLAGVSCVLAYSVITLPKTGGGFQPQMYVIFIGITMVLGNFIGTSLMDSLGRKPLLIASCASCAFVTGVSAIFYWAEARENITTYNWIPYACVVSYGITYSIGIGVIPITFVGELFPTNIKSFGSALSAIFFAIASFATNKMYLFVKENYGVHYMFGFFSLSSIVTLVFTIIVVFETKGKTFSEIQEKLNGRKETMTINDLRNN